MSHILKAPGGCGADSFVRLLEVFNTLETVAAVKDTESLHYQSLVEKYESLVQVICEDHTNAAESNVTNPELRASLIEQIQNECREILDYRLAAERWHLQIDWRSKDRIVSFGEKLSCRFMATLLRDRVIRIMHVEDTMLTCIGRRCRIRGS